MKTRWIHQATLELSGDEVEALLNAYADVYKAVHTHVPVDAMQEGSMRRLDVLFRELDFYGTYEFKS